METFANIVFTYNWRLVLYFAVVGLAFNAFSVSKAAGLTPENELLLDLRLEGERLGLDILGYQRNNDFLISLDELVVGLGFSIKVDASKGVADGWYISEDRKFSLDVARSEIISAGEQWSIAEGEVEVFEGGLYVLTNALEKWLPVQLSAVVRELYLDVVPTELLPIQQRLDRRKRVISKSVNSEAPRYPLHSNPYRAFGSQITDLRLGYSTSRQNPASDASYSGNYAWLSRGDVGWMTSTFSLAGNTEEDVAAARFKLERSDLDGPLGINHFEVGDVSTTASRGFSFKGGNGSGKQNKQFNNETTTIEGSQLPDWDVELYQNGQLIAIQTIGQDGRYLFENIPLLFGENRFEMQFFGPNGELDSRQEFYFLGPNMLGIGQVSYEASVVQKGLTVLGINDIESDDHGGMVYTGSANVGVLRNMTIGAGIGSQEVGGERITSSTVGFSLTTSRFQSNLKYNESPLSQDAVSTSFRTRFGKTNVNLEYTRYFDDPLLVNSNSKWQSNIDVSSTLYNTPVKVELSAREQENTSYSEAVIGTTIRLSGSGRLSTSLWQSSFEERSEDDSTTSSTTGGQTSFNANMRPWSFRLSTSYELRPELSLEQLSATSNLSIDNSMSLSLGIRQDARSDVNYYSSGISWRLGQFTIGTRLGYDSTERWTGLITARTTMIHKPGYLWPRLDRRASVSSGSVEAHVFESAIETEKKAVRGAKIRALQNSRNATTDEFGVAYLSQMPANRQIDIELDESTLADYELRSAIPGISVISRPGSYAIVKFPVVRTAELEGHVNTAINGEKTPVSRALVTLETPEGEVVKQTRTAFDGFYLFEGVEPGNYIVSLDNTMDKRVINGPSGITIDNNSGVVTGLDYDLLPEQAQIIVPAMRALAEESPKEAAESSGDLSLPTLATALPMLKTEDQPQKSVEFLKAVPAIKQQNKAQKDNGNWFVQIGAYGSRELAEASWERLRLSVKMFQAKSPRFAHYQELVRLLVGPGQSRAAANDFCRDLQVLSLDCIVREGSSAGAQK